MMKRILFLFLFSFLAACSKDDKAVLKQEESVAANSNLNEEIKRLNTTLKNAKDDSERSEIFSKIAVIETQKGDAAGGIKSALQSIKYYPNQYMAYYLLGKNYIETTRYLEASEQLAKSIELNAKFAPSHYELGNVYYKLNKLKEAVAEYKAAIAIDPNHYHAYNNLGVLNAALGNTLEAESDFLSAMQIKKDYAVLYRNLGILYDTKLNKKNEALINYKKYLEISPNASDRSMVKAWISVLGV